VLISPALHFCAFVGFMTANRATCRRSDQSMMSGEMARSTAHHSTFYAAFGFRRRRRCRCRCQDKEQDKENGGASNERFHFSLVSSHELVWVNPRRR
jgi:hypothetical protein